MSDYGTSTGYYRRDGRFVPPANTGKPCRRDERGIVLLPSNRPKNRIGITDELPRWRTIGWNVVFLAVEAALIYRAHVDAGVSWTAIGLGIGGVIVGGVGLFVYVALVGTPRAIRRHHELLQSYKRAAGRPHDGAPPLSPVTPDPDEVVDRQSTPHPAAPFGTSKPPIQVSRAR